MRTFGKFRYHREVPELPCHSELPCSFHLYLMKFVLLCSEVPLPFCYIKTIFPVAHYVSLISFLFPKHLSISFILLNVFACLWALGRMLLYHLFQLSINITFSEMFSVSLCSPQTLSTMGSTLFIPYSSYYKLKLLVY